MSSSEYYHNSDSLPSIATSTQMVVTSQKGIEFLIRPFVILMEHDDFLLNASFSTL